MRDYVVGRVVTNVDANAFSNLVSSSRMSGRMSDGSYGACGPSMTIGRWVPMANNFSSRENVPMGEALLPSSVSPITKGACDRIADCPSKVKKAAFRA